MSLEFKRANKVLGQICGYYFKDEFLSRYKSEAIQILRARVERAGNGKFENGKALCPDEWKVIHEEYERSKRATKKTYTKKKPYFQLLHKRALKHSLLTLQEKLKWKEKRRNEIVKDLDTDIEKIKSNIRVLEGRIK